MKSIYIFPVTTQYYPVAKRQCLSSREDGE